MGHLSHLVECMALAENHYATKYVPISLLVYVEIPNSLRVTTRYLC